jgi:DNA ligase-1
MKQFRPMLAPNQVVKVEDMFAKHYCLLASYKLDGIRCIFKDGEMLSRALKQFPNKQLRDRFESIKQYARCNNLILDGELLSKSVTFNELSGLTRQLDCKLPDDLNFYCFDVIECEQYNETFNSRIAHLDNLPELSHMEKIKNYSVFKIEEVNNLFENALAWGCDGLILRDVNGRYKFGRGTVKEGLIYKLKPFETFDAKILDVLQGTVVDPKAEKTINELGYSRTSKLKEDRLPSGRASDFVVDYEGKTLKVSIAMTQEEKEEVWNNKKKYIGRWIEYKGMLVGAKELPRHPIFLRFRDDKE